MLDTLKMLVIFEFNIITNCIVFEIIEKQWQLPQEVNHQLPLKKRKLDLWYVNIKLIILYLLNVCMV